MTTLPPPVLATHSQRKLSRVGQQIGRTPLIELPSLSPRAGVRVLAKLEWHQLGGSVKARAAFRIIEDAIYRGAWKPGGRLLDASSGNTGIAYASIGAALGIPLTLCLPENASSERKRILQHLGVDVILTDRLEGTDGAQRVAREMAAKEPQRYTYLDQYNNPCNWQAHLVTTAREILRQTHGQVTHFVAGLGTTGTFTGTVRGIRMHRPDLAGIALQPNFPMHGLEGWKHLETAIVPGIYDPQLADKQMEIDTGEAYDLLRFIARKEGLLISPSAAANLLGAHRVAQTIQQGCIVTMLADNADKYGEVLQQIQQP